MGVERSPADTAPRTRVRGFTLIELIVVIVVVGILAGVLAPLISHPTEAFIAETRRGALVDTAQTALNRISREVRLAVPNSVRIDATGHVMEFLRTLDGGRYRSQGLGRIVFGTTTTQFSMIGNLASCSQLTLLASSTVCSKEGACYVVIGNLGPGTGADAYKGDDMAKINQCIPGGSLALDGSDAINVASFLGLLGGKKFTQPSPNQRFQVVDTPVTYLCDLTAGTLTRYDGYTIKSNQSSVDTDAKLKGQPNPAEHSLLASNVTGCNFSYDATVTNLLTATLTITADGDSISLDKDIRVENQP